MKCKHYGSKGFRKEGFTRGHQRCKCKSCYRHFTNTPRGKPKLVKELAIELYPNGNILRGKGKIVGVSTVALLKEVKLYAN